MAYKFTAIPALTNDDKSIPTTVSALRSNLIAQNAAFIALANMVSKNQQRSLVNCYSATPGAVASGLITLLVSSDVLFIAGLTSLDNAVAGVPQVILNIDGTDEVIGTVAVNGGKAYPTTVFFVLKSMPVGEHMLTARVQLGSIQLNGVVLVAMALSA